MTGPGEPMILTELPTMRGVLRHGIYLQEKKLLMEDIDRRNYSIALMAKDVRMEVVSCWKRANAQFTPPIIITDKSIERKIQVAWKALEDFAWNRGGMYKETDRKVFCDKLDIPFYIASCNHDILSCREFGCNGCQDKAHLKDCNCRKEKRIPKGNLQFMMSMKVLRPLGAKAPMMISGMDIKETVRQNKAVERKERDLKWKETAAEKEKETEIL